MKNWLERHLLLTREERLLVAGIIAIALCGLAVKYWRRTHGDPPARPPVEAPQPPPR